MKVDDKVRVISDTRVYQGYVNKKGVITYVDDDHVNVKIHGVKNIVFWIDELIVLNTVNDTRTKLQAEIAALQDKLDALPKWPVKHGTRLWIRCKKDEYMTIDHRDENSSGTIKREDANSLYEAQLLLKNLVNWHQMQGRDFDIKGAMGSITPRDFPS